VLRLWGLECRLEDGGSRLIRNVDTYLLIKRASNLKKAVMLNIYVDKLRRSM